MDNSVVKVLIAIPTTEYIRHATFIDYFNLIQKPPETIVAHISLQSPAHARNIMIEQAIEKNCSHVLFLDDDIIPLPTIINDLLVHDKDIVSGLYLSRQYPHRPILFKEMQPDGYCKNDILNGIDNNLIEIAACGLGCCLVKIDVLKSMEPPWIRLGELEKDEWCDDIGFCYRLRNLGYKMYCDLNSPCGHMGSVIIRPHKIGENWFTSYGAYSTNVVTFPQAKE